MADRDLREALENLTAESWVLIRRLRPVVGDLSSGVQAGYRRTENARHKARHLLELDSAERARQTDREPGESIEISREEARVGAEAIEQTGGFSSFYGLKLWRKLRGIASSSGPVADARAERDGGDDALHERGSADVATGLGAPQELRDELDDAIRQAFASGWTSGAPDFSPVEIARVLEDPSRMRKLVAIQKAAWEVVERWVEAPAPAEPPGSPSHPGADARANQEQPVAASPVPQETGPEPEVHVPALLGDLFNVSRSEARRLIAQGAVKVNGRPLPPTTMDAPAGELGGRIQVGTRRAAYFSGQTASSPPVRESGPGTEGESEHVALLREVAEAASLDRVLGEMDEELADRLEAWADRDANDDARCEVCGNPLQDPHAAAWGVPLAGERKLDCCGAIVPRHDAKQALAKLDKLIGLLQEKARDAFERGLLPDQQFCDSVAVVLSEQVSILRLSPSSSGDTDSGTGDESG